METQVKSPGEQETIQSEYSSRIVFSQAMKFGSLLTSRQVQKSDGQSNSGQNL